MVAAPGTSPPSAGSPRCAALYWPTCGPHWAAPDRRLTPHHPLRAGPKPDRCASYLEKTAKKSRFVAVMKWVGPKNIPAMRLVPATTEVGCPAAVW
jgi:hypothetical protein